MNETYVYQTTKDDFRVRYELYVPQNDDFEIRVQKFISEYEQAVKEADKLTNTADGIDYAIAITSGIIAGLIDSFIVGEWDFSKAKAVSNEKINKKIQGFAEKNGLREWVQEANAKGGKKRDPDRLETAIEFLEKKFPLPGDSPWLQTGYDKYGNMVQEKRISPKSHHLDDLSHHPTIVGLVYCIYTQFTKQSIYYNSDGKKITIPITIEENGLLEGKTPTAKVGCGFINWCINVARNRSGHLMSDMGGSKNTSGSGMGLPGTIMSLLKELSSLPGLRDTDFTKKLSNAYKNGIGDGKNQINLGAFNCLFEGANNKVDLRTENAIAHELKRQSLPVAINEVIVRCCYFLRHFIIELKEKNDIEKVDFKRILPVNNRTIVRMITISSGVFELVDIADALIRGAVESKGNGGIFVKSAILRVNFVGIGRFAIACGTDVLMEAKKGRIDLALVSGDVAITAASLVKTIDQNEVDNNEIKEEIKTMKKANSAFKWLMNRTGRSL